MRKAFLTTVLFPLVFFLLTIQLGCLQAERFKLDPQSPDGLANFFATRALIELLNSVGPTGPTNWWTQVFADRDSIYAFNSDGYVYTWGANYYGQLGANIPTSTDVATPVKVCADTACSAFLRVSDVKEIDPSDWYIWMLKNDGTAWAWGHNRNGNFAGYQAAGEWGNNITYITPVQMFSDASRTSPLLNVQDHAAGYQANIWLAGDGSIYGQGWSYYEADPTTNYYQVPVLTKTPADFGGLTIRKVFTGAMAAGYAVLSDNSLWAWGNVAMFGDNHVTTATTFVHNRVCSVTDTAAEGSPCTTFLTDSAQVVDMVGAESNGVQALLDNGKVVSWGYAYDGEHGAGPTYPSPAYKPVEMLLGKNAVAIVNSPQGNTFHTLVVAEDGMLYAAGGNWDGQLGNGTTVDADIPVSVCADTACNPFIVDVAAIAAGNRHLIARGQSMSAAIKADGTLWIWGDDYGYGLFGNGAFNVQSNYPVQVTFDPTASP